MIFTEEQLNYVKKCLFLAVFSIVFELGMPHMSLAANENLIALSQGYGAPFENSLFGLTPSIDSFDMVISREEKISEPESLLVDNTLSFPNDNDPKVEKEMWVTTTAYFSDSYYTDATPFTTGWQTPVRDGVVAINFLPKGTMVKFPDMFGDKIFIVEDSMNARYTYRADIWMHTLAQAKQFGIKYLRMEILSVQLPRDYVLAHYEPAFPGKK